jgi:RNA polymerase sigma-70 factor (ECF subfamily)
MDDLEDTTLVLPRFLDEAPVCDDDVGDSSATAVAAVLAVGSALASVTQPAHGQSTGVLPRMGENEIDHALVLRIQQGDKRAFDLLVGKYQHKIISVISRYIKDWSEAQDVAQETFIRAYRALANFRGDSQFYTWLYKIAINAAKNHLVSLGRRPPLDDIDAIDAVQYDGGARLRDTDTPEHELMREEIERTVAKTVEDLPAELRIAITLREVDGLSYEEISEKMQCPIGTVRSRIFRARDAIDQKLRPMLEITRARP